MPKLLIALFLLGLISCSSPKTLSGYYRSNFAELGFFQTRIRFKTTDSLQYIFSGDMIYDSTVGHYNIFKNKLYITFKKVDIDTSIVGGAHDRFDSPLKFDTVGSNIIAYQSLFYIGNNKLFGTNVE